MGAEATLDWRLSERPEPDLGSVRISLLCLVDHEDRERQKYHTYDCRPSEIAQHIDHWRYKYPESAGWRNHQFIPTRHEVPKGFDDRFFEHVGQAPWWLEKLGYRHNTDFKLSYVASAAITNAIESLATSSTLLAGYESASIDNSTNKYVDIYLSGQTTVGTTPTAGTVIEHNSVSQIADGTWPDVFDGTTSAETVTSQGVKDNICLPIVVLNVDATTSNRVYYYTYRSLAELYNGFCPRISTVFTTHNTAVNLNSTGGNQILNQTGLYLTGT